MPKLCLLLCFLSLVAFGQETSMPLLTDFRQDSAAFPRYRNWQTGLGRQTLRDPLLSPLRYGGNGIFSSLNTLKYKPRFLTISTISLHVNSLGNKVNGASIIQTGGSYSYGLLKNLPGFNRSGRQIFVGGLVEGIFNFRIARFNVNNIYAYDAVVSLKVAGRVQQRFRLFHRDFMLTEQIEMPVFSVLSRPPFAWSYPTFLDETGKFSDAVQTGFWNRYFQIRNQLSLDFYRNIRHKQKRIGKDVWRISYSWEYFNINQPNRVQSGTQGLSIGKVIKF
jgi:hypothetical protein